MSGSVDHVLLPTGDKNVFIVIVVDIIQKSITGYFRLNLNKEYGIKQKRSGSGVN